MAAAGFSFGVALLAASFIADPITRTLRFALIRGFGIGAVLLASHWFNYIIGEVESRRGEVVLEHTFIDEFEVQGRAGFDRNLHRLKVMS